MAYPVAANDMEENRGENLCIDILMKQKLKALTSKKIVLLTSCQCRLVAFAASRLHMHIAYKSSPRQTLSTRPKTS